MNYAQLTLHQRITMKQIICDRKYRNSILSHKIDHNYFAKLNLIAYTTNYVNAINEFFNVDDTNSFLNN